MSRRFLLLGFIFLLNTLVLFACRSAAFVPSSGRRDLAVPEQILPKYPQSSDYPRQPLINKRKSTALRYYVPYFTGIPPTQDFLIELGIASVLGVATDPLVEYFYSKNPALERDLEIQETFGYGAADSISNAARLYAAIIGVTFVADRLQVDFLPSNLYESAPQIAFVVWAALSKFLYFPLLF